MCPGEERENRVINTGCAQMGCVRMTGDFWIEVKGLEEESVRLLTAYAFYKRFLTRSTPSCLPSEVQ